MNGYGIKVSIRKNTALQLRSEPRTSCLVSQSLGPWVGEWVARREPGHGVVVEIRDTNRITKSRLEASAEILTWHQEFGRENVCLLRSSRGRRGMESFVAFEGPVAVIGEIGVQEPVADFVGTGEAVDSHSETFCATTMRFCVPVDKSCGLDWDSKRRHGLGWRNLLRLFEADAEVRVGRRHGRLAEKFRRGSALVRVARFRGADARGLSENLWLWRE